MTYIKSLFQKIHNSNPKQKPEDSEEKKRDWLLDYYISARGLACLKTSAHDKGYLWARQLSMALMDRSDNFCDQPLTKQGNCLFWNNCFHPDFLEVSRENRHYTFQYLNRMGSNVRNSFEELQPLIKKYQPVLLTIGDLPLFLTGMSNGEADILQKLNKLRSLARKNNIAILGICPDHNTTLLGIASSCCESLSDTVFELESIPESSYLHKLSLLKIPPFGYDRIPVYLSCINSFQGFEKLKVYTHITTGIRSKYGVDSFIERKAIAKELRANGVDIFQIAHLFGVHESTIYKWTAENTKAENSFPFSEGTGKNVRYFKGKVIFDGKFH